MVITADDVKEQIILEVGDVDPGSGDPPSPASAGIIAQRIDYLWDRFASWDQVRPGLRELYCRQAAVRLVLGVLAPRRFDSSDTRGGVSIRAHQLVESYQQMLEGVTSEIETLRSRPMTGAVNYRGARLVTTAPVEAPCPPDPNALRYGGTVNGLEPVPPPREG